MDHLDAAARLAREYLEGVADRPVRAEVHMSSLFETLGGPVPEHGEDPVAVIEALVAGAEPGIVASAGPRYFGYVTGGSLPAALAADWMVSAWDQNTAFHSMSPAVAAIEQIAGDWVLELLGLPAKAAVGFVTGAQGANTTCLAAGRHAVLARSGWDVARDGLIGAPPMHVVCGAEAHATIYSALRLLGLGDSTAIKVAADDQGRMSVDALRETLAGLDGPIIVCAQAGHVSTGAFDDLAGVADACSRAGAWMHVDGAFGLWAAAAPSLRHLMTGAERADSWAVDAHKWLNVPYDCGIAIVADPAPLHVSMGMTGSYLVSDPDTRDNNTFVPESSRRGRAVPVYAALRSLGRSGLAELVERNCAQARRMAARLAEIPGAEVLNDVVLNQVLVRLPGDDEDNRRAIATIQRDGTCWLGGAQWDGRAVLRVSISNWSTTDGDIDRSADAIRAAATTTLQRSP
jgi:glutamate/tyrosine decarboxylase-like PLP-dependent enzyme